MRNIKKIYPWMASFIIAFMLFSSAAAFSDAGKARIFVDQAGRSVKVPDDPQRVVALAPSITEIIYALNGQDRLKGVTAYSDFPEAARALPRIGTYINPDIEKIVALHPDLCIAVKDGNPKAAVLRIESLGIPVYAVNPRNLSGIISSVIEIGEILKAKKSAGQLAEDMRLRIQRVEEEISHTQGRPKVFFQIGSAPIVSAGNDTFIHELIQKAGGVNLAGQFQSYPKFSAEEILALSPEIIIITTMSRDQAQGDIKAQWRQWPQIPAVKTDRIFVVDSDVFDRPTPRLIDGLELLVRLIHPELFSP